jgi:hypothetical protein
MEETNVIRRLYGGVTPVRIVWIQTLTGYTVRIFREETDQKIVEISGMQLGPALNAAVTRLEEVLT